MGTARIADLIITQGEDKLSLYQWNTRTARHYFCSVCGIYTHHQRRVAPDEFGFNLACIEDVDPALFANAPMTDGRSLSLVEETETGIRNRKQKHIIHNLQENGMGTIERIYIARGKRQAVEQVEAASLEAGKGIVGDRYHQLAEQHLAKSMEVMQNHVSLVEREALDNFMQDHGLDYDYGDFRRSVITSGVDLNALVGKQFRLGNAVLYGVELCEPCSYLASIIHEAVLPELAVSAGLRATVIESGDIKAGDALGELESAA